MWLSPILSSNVVSNRQCLVRHGPMPPSCSSSAVSALTSRTATTTLPLPKKVGNACTWDVFPGSRRVVSHAAWSLDSEEVMRSFEQVLNLLLRSSRSLPEDRRNVRD